MAKFTSSTASSSSIISTTESNSTSGSQRVTNLTTKRQTKASAQRNTNVPNRQATDKRKRLAANARERKRMHLLNSAYDRLRKRLADAENKSKYDVLVQAKEYIQALARICETHDKTAQVLPLTASGGSQDSRNASKERPTSEGAQRHSTIVPSRSLANHHHNVKLESPQSISESHCTEMDIECCSPSTMSNSPCFSLPDSVRSPVTPAAQIIPNNIIHPYQTFTSGQQQVPENLSCSTILNSPPLAAPTNQLDSTMTAGLGPDYLPRICQLKHQQVHSAHQLPHLNHLTNANIYHQYAQAFKYIQRAT